jgi:hypothetical protein
VVRTSTPGGDGKERGRVRGAMRRVSGRDDLDQAMRARFDPYSYESNWKTLRWLIAFLGVWTVLSLALAFNDNQTASYLEELSDTGLTTPPPGDIFPATVIAYSKFEGIRCDSVEEVVTFTEPCQRVVDAQRGFNSRKDRGNLMFAGLIVALIVISFPFSTVIHRASRNLPTLKSSGQRFSPDSSVIWFFVPIVNIVRPAQAIMELFKASDPSASVNETEDWKRTGKIPAIAYIWALAWGAAFIFNPILVQRVFFPPGGTIEGTISTLQTTVWSDAILGVAGLFAILMVTALHLRQEARHAKVGQFVYTPPPPELDLIQQAREERKSKPTPRLGGRVGKSRADIRTSGRERDE